jgi:hypothetical protein
MIIFYNQFRATQSILENERGMKKFQKNPLSLRSWATVLKNPIARLLPCGKIDGVGAMLEIQNGAGSGGGRD